MLIDSKLLNTFYSSRKIENLVFSNSNEKIILPLPTDQKQLGTTVHKSIKI